MDADENMQQYPSKNIYPGYNAQSAQNTQNI